MPVEGRHEAALGPQASHNKLLAPAVANPLDNTRVFEGVEIGPINRLLLRKNRLQGQQKRVLLKGRQTLATRPKAD
jgi:hypothetical protein